MQGKAIVAGAVGAAIGAGVWAVIAVLTGYQVGYVAWGIGAMIGFCAKVVGGRGPQTGVICAGLALASILAGKVIAVRIAAPREMGKMVADLLTRETYDKTIRNADEFAALNSEEAYPQYMISHEYSEAKKPEDVTAEEIEEFKREHVEDLGKLHSEHPTYEQWKEPRVQAAIVGFRSGLSTIDVLKASFSLMSILFLFLGVATAYRVGAGADEE